MRDRKQRILTGATFVFELGKQNRWDSTLFKRAAARLIGLLQDEINGVADPESSETIAIFNNNEE